MIDRKEPYNTTRRTQWKTSHNRWSYAHLLDMTNVSGLYGFTLCGIDVPQSPRYDGDIPKDTPTCRTCALRASSVLES
jgi:hypothetical protein